MPTYEYRCRDCGQDLEVVQSIKDDPLTVCPECEGSLRKVFSPIGIAFKGSGFYKTDNRSGSGGSGNGGSRSGGGTEGDTSSEKSSGSSSGSSDSSSGADSTGGGSGKETASTSS